MQPEDFYLVANELQRLAAGQTDAFVRSSISRTYYGAFHEAQRHLTGKNFRISPAGEELHSTHDGVIMWLKEENAAAGRALDDLRERRTWADYQLDRPKPDTYISETQYLRRKVRQHLGFE